MQIRRYENADACIEDFNLEVAKVSRELMNAERVASQAQRSWEFSIASASSQQPTAQYVDLESIALNSKTALRKAQANMDAAVTKARTLKHGSGRIQISQVLSHIYHEDNS